MARSQTPLFIQLKPNSIQNSTNTIYQHYFPFGVEIRVAPKVGTQRRQFCILAGGCISKGRK